MHEGRSVALATRKWGLEGIREDCLRFFSVKIRTNLKSASIERNPL